MESGAAAVAQSAGAFAGGTSKTKANVGSLT